MAIAKHIITAEEFALMAESRHAELIDGEVVQKMSTAKGHGGIAYLLEQALGAWMAPNSGYITHEEGLLIRRNPDQLRSPDVMYASVEALAVDPSPKAAFWQIQPELIAEVISLNETADDVRLKLRDYQSINVKLVLLIYASTREVEVHTLDGTAKSFRENDVLEFPQVLPRFRLEVAQLFKLPAAALRRYGEEQTD